MSIDYFREWLSWRRHCDNGNGWRETPSERKKANDDDDWEEANNYSIVILF